MSGQHPAVSSSPPSAGSQQFLRGLHAQLADVERHAAEEFEHLHKALANANAEIQKLRSQLAQQSAAALEAQPKPDFAASVDEAESERWARENVLAPAMEAVQSTPASRSVIAASRDYMSSSSGMTAGLTMSAERSWRRPLQPLKRTSTTLANLSDGHMFARARRLQSSGRRSVTSNLTHYKSAGCAARIVRSSWFEHSTIMVVLLNALWISVDLDANGNDLLESPLIFQVMEHLFVAFFTFEVVVRFLAYERKLNACCDKWFVFDATLMMMMVLESWVLTAIVLITGYSAMTGLNVLTVLRVFRLLRLARLSRLIKSFPELGMMMNGMIAGIRSVAIAAVILVTTTYSFAIVLRQLGSGTTWGNDHFGSVLESVYTLLIESMLPDNGELLGIIGRDKWYCGVIYWIFLMFSAITVMNMLIGILCEVVGQVSSDGKDRLALDTMAEKLEAMLVEIDKDYNGYVGKPEFELMLQNDKAIGVLKDVGIDVETLLENAADVFRKHGSHMTFKDFTEELLMFRITQQASMRSILSMRKDLRLNSKSIMGRLDELRDHQRRNHSLQERRSRAISESCCAEVPAEHDEQGVAREREPPEGGCVSLRERGAAAAEQAGTCINL